MKTLNVEINEKLGFLLGELFSFVLGDTFSSKVNECEKVLNGCCKLGCRTFSGVLRSQVSTLLGI